MTSTTAASSFLDTPVTVDSIDLRVGARPTEERA
jgi:hypothetical protein